MEILHTTRREALNNMLHDLPSLVEGQVSLALLRLVERTVDTLSSEQKILDGLIEIGHQMIATLNDPENGLGEQDPDGNIDANFMRAQSKLHEIRNNYRQRKQHAINDPGLFGDHEECILLEYDRTIERIEHLYSVLEDVRVALREHDADLSDRGPVFDSVADLISHLRH